MKINKIKWYLESDILKRPMEYYQIKENDEGGVLLEGTLMSIELDRRIIKYTPRAQEHYLHVLFNQSPPTIYFESDHKTVYLYKAPMASDLANMRPFVKRGIIGSCFQLGSVGHQMCLGPKWIQSGGSEVLVSPQSILLMFYQPPKLTAQAASLAKAVISAVREGGPIKVTEKTFIERKNICNTCEYYDPSAFMNTGRCRVCGCGVAKLQMANQECPKGKWGKESIK
jgi:hypothetical protein